jgi:uncharacterized protein (DUF1330 family)
MISFLAFWGQGMFRIDFLFRQRAVEVCPGIEGITFLRQTASTFGLESSTMAVYVIVGYDITDPEGFEGYVPGVVPLLQKHRAEILVADYESEPLEGEPRKVNVVLKFPSAEAARNWYNDPAYGPVKQVRLDTTQGGYIVLAKEFEPSA